MAENHRDRLTAANYRFIAICMALLAGTVWFSAGNFYRAFPEASIDFRVNRADAQALANRFLGAQGYSTSGYRDAASFTYDDEAKTFLEREAGPERANRLMGSRVRLWRWSNRWFKPLQKEEFRADVTPRGEVVGFEHEIAEDAIRPAIAEGEARILAEDFLRTRMHRDPATLEFVEGSDVTRPKRVDRTFTWKERDFVEHEATYRVEVSLLGNEVGGYREYLKIPEQWTRGYQRLRSKNEAAQTIDSAAMVVLVLGLVVVIVTRVRRQDVRWRRASLVGVVGTFLSLCASLNQFPLEEFGFATTNAYSGFLARQLLQALVTALGAGGLLFVLTAGAEPLYREMFGGKISLGKMFTVRGLRTKRFFLGAILGITLTGVFIAYQTAFYIVAYKFGAWSPADVPYSDLLNTRFPWLFVLFGGFFPAISEEFLFRMFAIPFLRKLTRSLPIAVVAAAFIWGFGHAGYEQQPFYIRGLEVGIGGVALGLVMLRWGILPTLVWHYSVDAMYSAMLLLRSHSLYFRLSGAASAGLVVLPVLVALVAYWCRGGFELEMGLLNADEPAALDPPVTVTAEPAAVTVQYRPLGARLRLAAIAVFALGMVTLWIPVSHFGASPQYKLTADQARSASDAFLRSRGLDPGAFQYVTYPGVHWGGADELAGKYFLERRPLSFASGMFERFRPVHYWATRYFKPLDQEEMLVTVHPESGKVLGYHHELPEDRPGADIPAGEARQIAAAFAKSQGRDVSAMVLKESTTEKLKARRDHSLEWEAPPGDSRNLDDTHFRVHAEVSGNLPSSLGSLWKLPEAFERSRSKQNVFSIAVAVSEIAVFGGGLVWALLFLMQSIRSGHVHWRTTITIGAIGAILTLAGEVLSLPLSLKNYDTATPLLTFQMMEYTGWFMSAIFGFLMVGGAAALVTSYFPESLAAFRAANRRLLGVDAGAAALAAIGLAVFSNRIHAVMLDRFHAHALLSFSSPDDIVSALPAVKLLAAALESVVTSAAWVAVVVLLWRKLGKWMVPLVLVALVALVPNDVRAPGEFALAYASNLLMAACAALFFWRFARNNYLAYVLVFWMLALSASFGELTRLQSWTVIAVFVASAAWIVLPGYLRPEKSAGSM